MSHEVTNCKSKFVRYPLIPEGRRRYVVIAPVKKLFGKGGGGEFYVWTLQYQMENGEDAIGEQALMPSMLGPLLRVLGCEEIEPDTFDWDTDDMEGAAFFATTTHAPDKKDSTIIRTHMSEFAKGDSDENQPEIGFDNNASISV